MEYFQWTNLWAFFSAIGGLATTIIAYLAYKQLHIMQISIHDAKNWNKINSAFSYLPKSHEFNEIECFLNGSFIKLIDRNEKLDSKDLKRIFDDNEVSNEVRIKLKNYLNLLESFCAAIRMGAVDSESAKQMWFDKFSRHYNELLPYIEHVRTKFNAPNIYEHLEYIVNSWNGKKDIVPSY